MNLFDFSPNNNQGDFSLYLLLRDDPKFIENKSKCEYLWNNFKPFADKNFISAFALNPDQRFFEMYLANLLTSWGYELCDRKRTMGPDLKIQAANKTIWIEASTPNSGETENAVPSMEEHNRFMPIPEEKIILRYTNSIQIKNEQISKYKESSIVKNGDVCVIAINGGRIEMQKFVSGPLPTIVKSVFPIGNEIVIINRDTYEPVLDGYKKRYKIQKLNGSRIGTDSFLNSDEYSALAGILYLEIDLWNNINLSAAKPVFVHNHQAQFPLPVGWIKHGEEFIIENGSLYKYKY